MDYEKWWAIIDLVPKQKLLIDPLWPNLMSNLSLEGSEIKTDDRHLNTVWNKKNHFKWILH